MRALVTGAGGFVGPHLLGHLHDEGDDALGTDRAGGGPDMCDPEAVNTLLAEARPDVIYHLAGDSDVGGSWSHPLSTFRANADGTLNLLTAARDAGVARVLCVGSADVYGRVPPEELPIGENQPLRPVSPYAASKVAAEYVALQAHLGFGQDTVVVRAFNHLGPGQSSRFVAPAIATRIARNERDGTDRVPVGNLSPRRDITDVRDVVRAYRLLAVSGVAGEAYNVCSSRTLAVSELAEALLALSGHPMQVEVDPDLVRPVDLDVLCGDNTKLRIATGWEPSIPIERTLADLLDDCRARVSAGGASGFG